MELNEITKLKKELLIEKNKLKFYEDNEDALYQVIGEKFKVISKKPNNSLWLNYDYDVYPDGWYLGKRQTQRLIQSITYRISWIEQNIYMLEVGLNEDTN